jgi:hypothetical protein
MSQKGLSLLRHAVVLVLVGCGASLPPRFVVERDLGDFRYRRYQQVLDVEFPVEGNEAVGHTASYVRRDRGDEVVFATAFVTVYEQPRSLVAEVRDRLTSLGTYEVEVGELDGESVWWLDGGSDRWALWVSGQHVIKLGAPRGEEIPEDIASEYADLYPSDLDENGRAKEGAASAGQSARQEQEEREQVELPTHLQENAPR